MWKQLQIISTITMGIGYVLLWLLFFRNSFPWSISLFPIYAYSVVNHHIVRYPYIMYTLASLQDYVKMAPYENIIIFFSTLYSSHNVLARMTMLSSENATSSYQRSHSFTAVSCNSLDMKSIILGGPSVKCEQDMAWGILTNIWRCLNITNDYTYL